MKKLALAVTLALAGCSIGSHAPLALHPEMPQLAPSKTARIDAVSIERWWTVFDDPALERLIDESLAHNADLESAAARVREAQASLRVVRAAELPTLDAKASSTRLHERDTFSKHRVTFEAGYEADLWGKLSSSTAAARHALLATEWARASFEWSLTAAVAEAYFELAAVERQIAISSAVRESRLSTVMLRQREHSVGAGTELDLRRAEAELASTDTTLAALGRTKTALERALNLLTGRSPAEIAHLGFTTSPLSEAQAFRAVLPQGAAADLLVRRPDVRQAEAELASANASIDAARAATLPSLRLTGSIGSDARSVSDLSADRRRSGRSALRSRNRFSTAVACALELAKSRRAANNPCPTTEKWSPRRSPICARHTPISTSPSRPSSPSAIASSRSRARTTSRGAATVPARSATSIFSTRNAISTTLSCSR